jgi:predicted transposase YdaD
MSTPHDAFFKAVFSRAEIAAGEFKALLPPALVAELDLSTARLLPGSFVDPDLAERHSDLLYSVEVAETETLIYVLFEHQSSVDRLMALRLLIYMSRAWDRWLRDHPGAERVPAILPLVLYQGPSAWSAATEFAALIDLPPGLFASVSEFLPSFRFLLDDLSQQDDAALRQRPV